MYTGPISDQPVTPPVTQLPVAESVSGKKPAAEPTVSEQGKPLPEIIKSRVPEKPEQPVEKPGPGITVGLPTLPSSTGIYKARLQEIEQEFENSKKEINRKKYEYPDYTKLAQETTTLTNDSVSNGIQDQDFLAGLTALRNKIAIAIYEKAIVNSKRLAIGFRRSTKKMIEKFEKDTNQSSFIVRELKEMKKIVKDSTNLIRDDILQGDLLLNDDIESRVPDTLKNELAQTVAALFLNAKPTQFRAKDITEKGALSYLIFFVEHTMSLYSNSIDLRLIQNPESAQQAQTDLQENLQDIQQAVVTPLLGMAELFEKIRQQMQPKPTSPLIKPRAEYIMMHNR